jgi:hypothetical protein
MDRLFRVKINVALVQSHLSRDDRRDVSETEVLQFLRDSGFVPQGNWWIVKEAALGALDPSEVTEAEIMDDPSADAPRQD